MEREGQASIVTGASSGLGRATALALAHAGKDVALVARSVEDLEEVAQEISDVGRHALPLAVDLADETATRAAVSEIVKGFGHIDVLVNAAGTDAPGPVADLSLGAWDRVLAVNLTAPFMLSKAVFPHMQKAGQGTIVNVSSVAGKRGWANAGAYCTSKFGLTGFTQALAAEGKPYGIRACIIYPGSMATSWGAWSREERVSKDDSASPPAESLPPEDVAGLIVWIANAPRELVLSEVVVTPLKEQAWP